MLVLFGLALLPSHPALPALVFTILRCHIPFFVIARYIWNRGGSVTFSLYATLKSLFAPSPNTTHSLRLPLFFLGVHEPLKYLKHYAHSNQTTTEQPRRQILLLVESNYTTH